MRKEGEKCVGEKKGRKENKYLLNKWTQFFLIYIGLDQILKKKNNSPLLVSSKYTLILKFSPRLEKWDASSNKMSEYFEKKHDAVVVIMPGSIIYFK